MGSIEQACISGFLCRLCSEMHRIVIHIYGDQGQRLCLVEKINGYLPITISPTDPLPKTICTTCLRRVEQHYDLLMRLSRIKEERFVRVNKHRHHVIDFQHLPEVSSIDNSEDDVLNSDDDSRQLRQTQSHLSSSQQPSTSSSSATVAMVRSNSSTTNSDDEGAASTSASALAEISQNVTNVEDDASSPSDGTQPGSFDVDDGIESVLQVHND